MAYDDSSQKPTLNVILHGACALVQDDRQKQIRAYMPKLDYHVYRAGTWLAEVDLAAGKYTLEGVPKLPEVVSQDELLFDPKRNVILKGPSKVDQDLVYATLIFPFPRNITSLRLAEVPTSLFSQPGYLLDPDDKIQTMATLQVLTYDIEDENKLALTTEQTGANELKGHYWEPVFTGNYINLHVFSSEDHYHRPSNSKDDFNVCARLLGSPVELITKSQPAGEVTEGEVPDGVIDEETEGLPHRTMRMARLGRLVRQNSDANLAWYGNDALDDDPLACGFCGMRDW